MTYDPDIAAIIRLRLDIEHQLNTARISSETRAQLRLELVTLTDLFNGQRTTASAMTAALTTLQEKLEAAVTAV